MSKVSFKWFFEVMFLYKSFVDVSIIDRYIKGFRHRMRYDR